MRTTIEAFNLTAYPEQSPLGRYKGEGDCRCFAAAPHIWFLWCASIETNPQVSELIHPDLGLGENH